MSRPQAPPVVTRVYRSGAWRQAEDWVVAEEPLQLSLDGEPLSVIMRTPGADLELALGLLWAERVITDLDQVECVLISAEAGEPDPAPPVRLMPDLIESNQVDVRLKGQAGRRPERSFLATSACGVCGAVTVESLALELDPVQPGPLIEASLLVQLPARIRSGQRLFERTGGLHAAALFSSDGRLIASREDVGRHNAVDKVVGHCLLRGRVPVGDGVLVVSGRGGYELVQKAVAAGIPIMAAVGAPSSLAVQVAQRFGMTLVGFLRGEGFNLYSGPERVLGAD